MKGFKNNFLARKIWGNAYDNIPKSVFAIAAWYLSDACSDVGVGNEGELQRFMDEINALRDNGLIEPGQARRVLQALIAEQI